MYPRIWVHTWILRDDGTLHSEVLRTGILTHGWGRGTIQPMIIYKKSLKTLLYLGDVLYNYILVLSHFQSRTVDFLDIFHLSHMPPLDKRPSSRML